MKERQVVGENYPDDRVREILGRPPGSVLTGKDIDHLNSRCATGPWSGWNTDGATPQMLKEARILYEKWRNGQSGK